MVAHLKRKMRNMNAKTAQITLLAAALAVTVLAAVFLLASGNPAQATTTSLAPDGGGEHRWPEQGGSPGPNPTATPEPGDPTETPTPEPSPTPVQQTQPEDCLTPAASVISSGHYAIFEAYWDTEDRTLVNNPCPAKVTHHHGSDDDDSNDDEEHETHTRAASDIDIGSTVFHISGTANTTVSPPADKDEAPTEDQKNYRFLYPRVEEEHDTEDGKKDGILFLGKDGIWTLPTCTAEGGPPATDSLCFGFSTALLRADDWETMAESDGDDLKIEYHLVAVREDNAIAPADRGHVFAIVDEDGLGTGDYVDPIWSSYNIDDNEIRMPANEYLHPHWVFTEPGTYLLQLHAHGRPTDGFETEADTVTSVVQTYTFHVGKFADIAVTVNAAATDSDDTTLDPGDEVTIKVTASNDGPDTATSAKVDVTLPDGLTYGAAQAETGTYDAGVWEVGDLDKDAEATLTLTATVAEGTRGQELAVMAEIYATEHIGSSDVVELDPRTDDNTSQATLTPGSIPNVNPVFRFVRSVAENRPTGTLVGDPVAAFDSDDAELTYSLSGNHAAKFRVNDQGQLSLSKCGVLDYESRSSYSLTVSVSDGKDEYGNVDSTVDHVIGVLVKVTDVDDTAHPKPGPAFKLTADTTTPAVNDHVTLTAKPINLHHCDPITFSYNWSERDPADTGTWTTEQRHSATQSYTHDSAGGRQYQVYGHYTDANGNLQGWDSNIVLVEWQ